MKRKLSPLPYEAGESTSYVISFRIDSVFLRCDHGLDFLHQLIIMLELNQSVNQCGVVYLYLSVLYRQYL